MIKQTHLRKQPYLITQEQEQSLQVVKMIVPKNINTSGNNILD